MSAAWERDPVGVWRLRVASDHHGMAWRPLRRPGDTSPRLVIARAVMGRADILTTHPSVEAAKAWVEYELGVSGRTT